MLYFISPNAKVLKIFTQLGVMCQGFELPSRMNSFSEFPTQEIRQWQREKKHQRKKP